MNRCYKHGVLPAIGFLLLALAASAQDTAKVETPARELRTCRVNGHTPVVDGNLSEPAWDTCTISLSNGFTQREPDEGKPETESTKVAVLYDDNALYVAFWCFDSEPDKIRAELVRRDRWAESDYVEFQVDPFHDHQTGYEFTVSAAGVLADGRYYNDDNFDGSWDGVWEGDIQRQPWGYSVEMKIPYHCLRFSEQDNQTWGINFTRGITRKKEYSKWCFSPQSDGGFVSRFGHLTDLENLKPTGHTQIMPYAVSSLQSEPKSVGNPDGRSYSGNTGVDMKFPLASDLVVDATVNPDFGQVELDQPVLNLSAYETFYEEKRPFFMEGANLFVTRYNLFYSRRIGRQPQCDVDDPDFGYYKDFPKTTTILGAGRITGKAADRTTIALLTAVTQREKAEYAALLNWQPETTFVEGLPVVDTVPRDTLVRKGMVEPQASYSVLRVKQDILRNSFVGGMLTVASQDRVHPSVCGGVDWRLTTNNRMWAFRGQTLFSRVDPVKTGYGVDAIFEKTGGQHTRGNFAVRVNSPDLNLNRLGYQPRKNAQVYSLWFEYRTTDDWWIIRNTYNHLNLYSNWNYDGVNYSRGGNINTNIEFKNGWYMFTMFSVQGEKYSDDETRGNGLWVWPEYPTIAVFSNFNTDSRKPVSFWWGARGGADRGGDWWGADVGTTVKPRSNIECNLWTTLNRYFDSYRWLSNRVDTIVQHRLMPVFGTLDWDQFSFGVGVNYLFRRNLSLQVSAEGLINGLDYSDYRFYRLQDDSYYSTAQLANWNRDYNYSALNTMMLLRWEYRPGSTLYLVWTRARDEFDDRANNLDFSRDFKRLFSAGSSDVFLIKMSYWLNM
jgi:hypothetical protein